LIKIDGLENHRFYEFLRDIDSDIYRGNFVMPDLIRHPVPSWIPAFSGMTEWAFFNYPMLSALCALRFFA